MVLAGIIILSLNQLVWCFQAQGSAVQARQESPVLPDRSPFGFGAQVTGGGSTNNTYIVDNMMDLRSALTNAEVRTVYVKGEIKGSQVNETTVGNCQYYIDTSTVPGYNFTLYLMALNTTYTDAVKAAVASNETFEGRNASEYLTLLGKQNVGSTSATWMKTGLRASRDGGDRRRMFRSHGSPSMFKAI